MTEGGPLSVSVQESVYAAATDSEVLLREPGAQYLAIESAAVEDSYEVASWRECEPPLTVRLDGSVVPLDRVRCLSTVHIDRFAVEVPVERFERGTVELLGDVGRFPERTLDALAARPQFRLDGARVVGADGRAALEVTVANEGDRDGVWHGLRRRRHTTGTVRLELPVRAGERRTAVVERLGPPLAGGERHVATDIEPETRYLRLGDR